MLLCFSSLFFCRKATVGRRTWKNDDGNGCTVHSVVYNLTDKTALWVTNENCGDPTAVFPFRLGD